MSPLSVGFLCLLGIESGSLFALVTKGLNDQSNSLRISVYIFYVVSVSAVINCCYLIVWFTQVQMTELLK